MKKLSIILVYYNTPKEIIDLLNSLEKQLTGIEVIIVNNSSPKPLPNEVLNNKRVQIINNKSNTGFGRALNQGSRIATGKYLLFLNPDTLVQKDFVKKILRKMEKDKKIGLMGIRYNNLFGKTIKSVGGFPTSKRIIFSFSFLRKLFPKNKPAKEYWMENFNYEKETEVPVVGGACMIVRTEVFRKVKGFEPQFFMYFEEADLSERIRRAGYKILYYPGVAITHLVGKSSSDKELIKKRFEESRYKIIKKYEGRLLAILTEGIVRLSSLANLLLTTSILVSLFLNLYKIDTLMMFYGDFGRDYLAARDMLLTGEVPLRGIPSSVVWLHQGPLSIYFIGLAFLIGKLNPVAPAILYALLGVCSTVLAYIVGKLYFNSKTGLIASFLYATSPLIVINARMPYHTASIPFFTLIFFIILFYVLKGKKRLLPLLLFVFGLLFQLELSNSLLFIVLIISLLFYKFKLNLKDILASLLGFVTGVLPFVVYDITNHFTQLGGFVLWTLNRIRLFLGIATLNESTTGQAGSALETIWLEVNRVVFPSSQLIVSALLLLGVFFIIKNYRDFLSKNKYYFVILLGLIIPLIGFLVHAKPGVAYTPLIFPCLILFLAFTFVKLISYHKMFLIPLLAVIILNSANIVQNNYFLTSESTSLRPTLVNYSYGLDLSLREKVASVIVKDAKGERFSLQGGGYLQSITTGIDNYKYLVLYKRGNISELGSLQYRIYENKNEIKDKRKIIFQNKYTAVTKNE